jgi:hypothetical protein
MLHAAITYMGTITNGEEERPIATSMDQRAVARIENALSYQNTGF